MTTLTPGVAANDPDPMRNKALQLVELFRLAHEWTVAAGRDDIAFASSVPEWLADGPFWAILPQQGGMPPSPEERAQRMSLQFIKQAHGDACAQLADIFYDRNFAAPVVVDADRTVFEARTAIVDCVLRGHLDRISNHPDRAMRVKTALTRARAHPSAADLKANILYLEACDALSRGAFDVAGKVLERGLDLCGKGGCGAIRLEIARLHFALSVARAAFDQNRCEAAFRVFVRVLSEDEAARWKFPEAPIEYTMRLAAVDLSDWFWEQEFRPYPGVEIARMLWDQMRAFEDWRALLRIGADQTKIGEFFRTHKKLLKRKLTDVRGDTFFTCMTKMMWGLERGVEADRAAVLRRMHRDLARVLPADFVDACDFRKQTPLILAANRGDHELLCVLLGKHVDLDAQDILGRTALHAAVRSNSRACIASLLERGADPALRSCAGKTPAVLAAELGRAELFELLLAHPRSAVDEATLEQAVALATRNTKASSGVRSIYERDGVKLGAPEDFQEILSVAARHRLRASGDRGDRRSAIT